MFYKFNDELKEKNINLELDLSFLNIFEKNTIFSNKILEEKDIKIANKICEYIEKILYINKNKTPNKELKSFIINCDKPNIDGLIYKIKNNLSPSQEEDSQNYESKIIKEIFKIIVPTFSQEIIASLFSSELAQKYKQFNEIVIEIYNESKYYNFKSFFEKIEYKKI